MTIDFYVENVRGMIKTHTTLQKRWLVDENYDLLFYPDKKHTIYFQQKTIAKLGCICTYVHILE